MKLYFSPGACSLSPHIVLRELGLEFELEQVDLATKKTKAGEDFLAVNPKGYVPALVLDDGQVLTEGPAIVQCLADLRPEAGLAPKWGTMERVRLQEWLTFIGTELHKSYSALFNKRAPAEYKEIMKEVIGKRIAFVAGALETKPFLMGDTFTVADAYLYTVLSWSRLVGIDHSPWPSVVAFLERVNARPAVQAARDAEKRK